MKALRVLLIVFLSSSAFAAQETPLTDVNKDSKLSDYFKNINAKVSAESEPLAVKSDTAKKADSEKEAVAEKSESQIPLLGVKAAAKAGGPGVPKKLMLGLVAVLGMAGVVIVALQKMGKNTGHTTLAKNINILTQKSLGPKKQLMLIQVAGETILLGVTDHNINHIKTLSLLEDELPNFIDPKFADSLKTKIEETKITEEQEVVDGFAISRLDDVKSAVTRKFSL